MEIICCVVDGTPLPIIEIVKFSAQSRGLPVYHGTKRDSVTHALVHAFVISSVHNGEGAV